MSVLRKKEGALVVTMGVIGLLLVVDAALLSAEEQTAPETSPSTYQYSSGGMPPPSDAQYPNQYYNSSAGSQYMTPPDGAMQYPAGYPNMQPPEGMPPPPMQGAPMQGYPYPSGQMPSPDGSMMNQQMPQMQDCATMCRGSADCIKYCEERRQMMQQMPNIMQRPGGMMTPPDGMPPMTQPYGSQYQQGMPPTMDMNCTTICEQKGNPEGCVSQCEAYKNGQMNQPGAGTPPSMPNQEQMFQECVQKFCENVEHQTQCAEQKCANIQMGPGQMPGSPMMGQPHPNAFCYDANGNRTTDPSQCDMERMRMKMEEEMRQRYEEMRGNIPQIPMMGPGGPGMPGGMPMGPGGPGMQGGMVNVAQIASRALGEIGEMMQRVPQDSEAYAKLQSTMSYLGQVVQEFAGKSATPEDMQEIKAKLQEALQAIRGTEGGPMMGGEPNPEMRSRAIDEMGKMMTVIPQIFDAVEGYDLDLEKSEELYEILVAAYQSAKSICSDPNSSGCETAMRDKVFPAMENMKNEMAPKIEANFEAMQAVQKVFQQHGMEHGDQESPHIQQQMPADMPRPSFEE